MRSFFGDPADAELPLLQRFLELVLERPFGRDIRQLELRSWRDKVAA